MKKITAFLLILIFAAGLIFASGSSLNMEAYAEEKLQIVTTIFPEYDWLMNILGDNPAKAEVTLLLNNGVDLHSFQPTAQDILKISTCDLFIYVGGESDKWVEDALKEATNENMVVLNLLDVLGEHVKEEEIVEGMQAEEHDNGHEEDHDREEGAEHEEDHDNEAPHIHEEEAEYDEHVWLSLRNAEILVDRIAEALSKLDAGHADVYDENAGAYTDKLHAMDEAYREAIESAAGNTILFGDRFPFRYLTDDYGLTYYAAFAGCSAETEASFETIIFLVQKVDELSLPAVLTLEGKDHRIAETIVQSTKTKDQQILTMDSMQGTTEKDITGGTTYLSIMEKNLAVLQEALK